MLKILVVDDEADVPLLIKQRFRAQIKERQLEFRFAASGVEALVVLDAEPDVDMILSDINMPEMDGLTLLSTVTSRGPMPKTVMVSAYGDMQNIRTAMNRGAFDFVTKPIDFNDLQVTIAKTQAELSLIKQALRSRDELVGLRRELEIAAAIQRALLPRGLPPDSPDGAFEIYGVVVDPRLLVILFPGNAGIRAYRTSIIEDLRGNLWIGSNRFGLWKLRGSADRAT